VPRKIIAAGAFQQTLKQESPMTTAELAKAYTDLLKAGDYEGVVAFNSPDIVSLEAMDGPMARIQGTAAIKAKSDWWYANNTVHSMTAEGPYVNGDQFALVFDMDITDKQTGKRMQMKEVGLYTVKGGKVVEERFMY
jgi:ketosteroid isomerase-like protein